MLPFASALAFRWHYDPTFRHHFIGIFRRLTFAARRRIPITAFCRSGEPQIDPDMLNYYAKKLG